jgi:heme exporter protein D
MAHILPNVAHLTGDTAVVAILTVVFAALAVAISVAVDRQTDLLRQIHRAERQRQQQPREREGSSG